MNINSISNTNFQSKISNQLPPKMFSFYVPGREKGTKLISTIYADNKNHIKILDYKLKYKNEILDEGSFKNKKGFNEEALKEICKELQNDVNEKIDYAAEFFNALFIKKL